MNKIIFSFLTTTIAGFSTMLGIIPCYLKNKNQNKIICTSLSFAGGVMLYISLFSLIPESINLLKYKESFFPSFIKCLILTTIGIIISNFIVQKTEHIASNNKLYKLGIISIIALMLHNIPEGITTFISTTANPKLGISLAIAIALHNIPEGISIAIPIYYSTYNIKKAVTLTAISGFSELLGAVLAFVFIPSTINNNMLAIILAITAGIMLHIAAYELIPTSKRYGSLKTTVTFTIIGFSIMNLLSFLF